MKIEITFSGKPASPRKRAIKRILALMAVLAIALVVPASAKYAEIGGTLMSTEINGMSQSNLQTLIDQRIAASSYPAAVNTPTLTGETYAGQPVYIARFTGTITAAPNTQEITLLLSVAQYRPIEYGGWIKMDSTGLNNILALGHTMLDGASLPNRYAVLRVSTAGSLDLISRSSNDRSAGAGAPYDVWVKYYIEP